MADFRNVQDWDPGVSSSTLSTGTKPGKGAIYDVKAGPLPLQYHTLEWVEPQKTVLEATTKLLRSYDVITVTSVPEGALVTYDATLELKGVAALANPLLGLAFDRVGDRAAAGLAKALNGTIQ